MKLSVKQVRTLVEQLMNEITLVYGDTRGEPFQSKIPISEWDEDTVMKVWKKHRENRAFLFFMYKNGTIAEKQQAAKELEICDRKLAFWERHPQFNRETAGRFAQEIMKQWAKKGKL